MSDFFETEDDDIPEEKTARDKNLIYLGVFVAAVIILVLMVIAIGESSKSKIQKGKIGNKMTERQELEYKKRYLKGNSSSKNQHEPVNREPQSTIGGYPQNETQAFLSVVRVLTEQTSGSGTLLSRKGYFITNNHVVKGSLSQLILFTSDPKKSPEQYFVTQIVYQEESLDLAVLQIAQTINNASINDLVPIRIGNSSSLKLGDEILICGYPGVGGDTITLTRGVISGFLQEHPFWIKTDANMFSGNSGGGAFNHNGEFIGVPSAGAIDKRLSSQIGMIMPINSIKEHISKFL